MEPDGIGSVVDSFAFEGGQLTEAEYSNHRLLNAEPKLPQDVRLYGVATARASSCRPSGTLLLDMR